ncbi:MAG: MG2 domain-containing protein [Prevotellaceae bacterium]|nr:MG2 domain-containing protein [Prevotellaceae bacterium]
MKRLLVSLVLLPWLALNAKQTDAKRLAGMLEDILACEEIHPDSVVPYVARIEAALNLCENESQAKVYSLALGALYSERQRTAHFAGAMDYGERSVDCFAYSLSDLESLHEIRAKDWIPVTKTADAERYFNGDMLNVAWRAMLSHLGKAVRDTSSVLPRYGDIISFYKGKGNEEAALLLEIDSVSDARLRPEERERALLYLCSRYAATDVCAEAWLALSETDGLTAEQRAAYLDHAIALYPKYRRIAALKNARTALSDPTLYVEGPTVSYPGKPCLFTVSVRNVPSVKLDGKLYKLKEAAEIDEVIDTITWQTPREAGRHRLTFTPVLNVKTTKKPQSIERSVLVTRLKVLYNSLPDSRVRVIVVDSESGEPLRGVTVSLYEDGKDSAAYASLFTDERGEVLLDCSGRTALRCKVSTDDEPDRPIERLHYGSYWRESDGDTVCKVALFTDRSIYRPGQTINVGGVAYLQDGWEASVASGRRVLLTLRDAQYKEVAQAEATCDSLGVFSASFTAEEGHRLGRWSVRSGMGSSAFFRVEEYKRPTFTIEFCDSLSLTADSLTCTARALRYDGVPMRGCRVTGDWDLERWTFRSVSAASRLDTVQTDAEGRFSFTLKRDSLASILRLNVTALSAYGEQQTVSHSYTVPGSMPWGKREETVDSAFIFTCPCDTFCLDRPARMTLSSNLRDLYLYYIVSANGEIVTDTLMLWAGGSLDLTLPYEERFGTGAVVSLCFVKGGRAYTATQRLSLRKPDTELRLRWLTFRDKTSPGSRQEWRLSLARPDGTPAEANLMLTLYDASLERLAPHKWALDVTRSCRYFAVPYAQTSDYLAQSRAFASYSQKRLKAQALAFSSLNERLFARHTALYSRAAGAALLSSTEEDTETTEEEAAEEEEAFAGLRQDFSEEAVFLPTLRTDERGEASVVFTLPESLTTWRLLAVAHTKDMMTTSVEEQVIAEKDLTAQLRLPRFLRPGDEATLTASLTNNTDSPVECKTVLQVIEASSLNTLRSYVLSLRLEARGDTVLSFPCRAGEGDLIVRCTAESGIGGDGEQRLLPVLPAVTEANTTLPFTALGQGVRQYDLTRLFPEGSSERRLTLEYTSHPEEYALEALRPLTTPKANDVLSLAVAYYASRLASSLNIAVNDPTPYLSKVRELQRGDGSFAWYPGMTGNAYLTREVAYLLGRLKLLTGDCGSEETLSRAARYLLQEMPVPESVSTYMLRNLYAIDLADLPTSPAERAKLDSLVSLMRKADKQSLSTEDLALSSIILQRRGYGKLAKAMAEEAASKLVTTDTVGTYIEFPQGAWSSVDRKLHIHVQLMEALRCVQPSSPLLEGMRLYLLSEKRTDAWETPVTSANAVFALFEGREDAAEGEAPTDVLTLSYNGSKQLTLAAPAEGAGYVRDSLSVTSAESLRLHKLSDQPSWGAAYADYRQPFSEVTDAASGLSVSSSYPEAMSAGQRITVTHLIVADRDYDYVTLVVPRPASLEPVDQTSSFGHCDGLSYYREIRDECTEYHFSTVPRGHYLIQEEAYTERPGSYHTGVATIRCEYAPVYSGHSSDTTLTIK